jgi:hypothetical protein
MARNWQKVDIGPEFKGLLRRRQMQLEDPTWFQEFRNVDCYGGTLGKRFGMQLVNGYGSYVVASPAPTTTAVPVADCQGFVVGQTITVRGSTTATIASTDDAVVAGPGGVLNLTAPLPFVPVAGDTVVQAFIAGPIQTLFQAIYRDQSKRFLAAINNMPYYVLKGTAPGALPTGFPITQVFYADPPPAVNLGTLWLKEPNITIGDWVWIPSLSNYNGRVWGWYGAALIDPPLPSWPAHGTPVYLYPQRGTVASVSSGFHYLPEMVQYGNMTHYTSGPQDRTIHLNGAPDNLTPRDVPLPNMPLIIEKNGTVRRHGIKPGQIFWDPAVPGTVPTVESVNVTGGALIPGQKYKYRFRYVNRVTGQESEGSIEQGIQIDAGDNAVRILLPKSSDPQVTDIRLYRTTANGGGAWYRVHPVYGPDGTTSLSFVSNATQYIHDKLPDNQLGAQMRNLQDYTIADTVAILAIWGQANRLVGIDPVNNWVVYSDQPDLQTGQLKGESWPVNNQIFVSYDDGDRLTGIAAFFDSLLIFKEHSVWRITGVPPDLTIAPVHFRQDQTGAGALNQRSIVVDHNEVMFRGTDAIYQLNRFQGQAEGFESKRVSIPIDDLLQDQIDVGATERQVDQHAVYFRFKRQLRVWLTTDRLAVLQFEAGAQGEPLGWAEWEMGKPPPVAGWLTGLVCSCIARYDPGIFRGSIFDTLLISKLDSGVFAATPEGVVLQMDIGQADYGCVPHEVWIKSLFFAPGGRGMGARVRAIDWQVAAINDATTTLRVETDFLRSVAGIQAGTEAHMPVPPEPAIIHHFPDTVDVIAAERYQYRMYSTLFVAPGQYHQFSWREQSLSSMYRIAGLVYWFQALPEAVVRRRVLQPTVEPTEREPPNVVIQG